jgi:glycosyltransferase involved in cell wall biosynthesis
MPSVADVSDAYDASDIVIVPIRFGTGLKIKTIEALGRAKPTISTSVGAEGLEMARGKAMCVADEPEAFADAILQLVENGPQRRALSDAAFEFAAAWNAETDEAFASVLATALSGHAAD